jgi:hypothetical protein
MRIITAQSAPTLLATSSRTQVLRPSSNVSLFEPDVPSKRCRRVQKLLQKRDLPVAAAAVPEMRMSGLD